MKNLKTNVVSALKNDSTLINLLGGEKIYYFHLPEEPNFPLITYYEGNNKDYAFFDDLERNTEAIFIIDVYTKGTDLTDISQAVDNVMYSQGFFREFTNELYEQDDEIYHKNLRYRKLTIYDGNTGTITIDSWLDALATWTENELGTSWTVSKNNYPVDYTRPQVMWLITNFSPIPINRYMYRVTKTFNGIVVGDVPQQHLTGAFSIITGLQRDIKITLDSVNNRYLTVDSVKSDFNADSITVGRVSLTLSRFTDRPQEDIPYIQHVYSDGNMKLG